MKCLEDCTIEQVKEMSFEELKVLCENMDKEEWITNTKRTIIDMLGVIEAKKPLIKS